MIRQTRIRRLGTIVLSFALVALFFLGTASGATRAADDPLAVPMRRVAVRAPTSPGGRPIEFRGLIQRIEQRYWVISERLVLVTEETLVHGTPQIGALAEVKGSGLYADLVLARRIEVIMPGSFDQVEFEGVLESIRGDAWVVGGVSVTITPITTIQGSPALGWVVEVQGMLQPDGSVLAQQVIVKEPSTAAQVEVAGEVESITAGRWVVAGTSIVIDEKTLIDDSRAPAEVGMWAEVQARPDSESSLVAIRIRLSRPR